MSIGFGLWVNVNHDEHTQADPDSKVHGANMGPIWGRQDPGGSHVGPVNFAIWGDKEREKRVVLCDGLR